MQWRLSKGRRIEALLMLPATATLGPALPFGIVFTALALAAGLAVGLIEGASTFTKQLRSSGELTAILLMMLAGAAGLGSLWLNILFGRDWAFARARRRYALVGAIVAGLAAAAYWFLRLDMLPRQWRELKAFWVWIALLGPPCAIAVRYLCILLTSGRSAEARPHAGSNS
jgi:hypothetical protein